MKFRKVIVKKYIFKDKRKSHIFKDITILVTPESKVTRDNFNQSDDMYFISSKEIERMAKKVDENYEENEKKKV